MIKGIIFDMDGLMLDTEKLLLRFWCEAAREFGYPMEKEHVLSIRSLAAKYAIPKLKGYFGEDFDYPKVRSRRMELMNQFIEEQGIEKKKGLDELLAFLKENHYKISVATATDLSRTQKYLKNVGIDFYFDKIICASMVENGKPAPDIYLKAAEELSLPPKECMALEDSPNGILSAYRAGCLPVMIPDLDQPGEETKKLLFGKKDNLEQVIEILQNVKEEEIVSYFNLHNEE
ncbi:MAG: HAD family phosphatase [Lachnospiraceae bacterium]|nr:HAD family phosphatase [Lachnospiraceae bacterium]